MPPGPNGPRVATRAVWRLLRHWLWDQWHLIHAESLSQTAPRSTLDYKPLVILVVVAVSLTLQEYLGQRADYQSLFAPASGSLERYDELLQFGWWAGWRVLGFVLLPMAVLLLLPGERIRDYGLSVRGFRRHLWIYLALFLAILPLVVAVSFTEPFQDKYPFYRQADRSVLDFVGWELMYAAQFLSLEFFFRGFMVHGLKRSIGAHAIWVMMVPYTMIHFGKPLPETLGAIVAGLVLGTLSLRTGSIWAGVLSHISVALTMDLLTLRYLS